MYGLNNASIKSFYNIRSDGARDKTCVRFTDAIKHSQGWRSNLYFL